MDSIDDVGSWPEPPDLFGVEGKGDDPVFAASMLLHLMRTMRVLERSQAAGDAINRIRDSSGEWSATQEAQIGLDAFEIIDNIVARVVPNVWWGDQGNEAVGLAMRLLRGLFEELPKVAAAAEWIGGSVQPDPSAPGGARARTGKQGRDPSIVAACAKALLPYPEIARLCVPDWEGKAPFPYKRIKNTKEVREALHRRLKGYPYYFDGDEVGPQSRGPLWKILNSIQRVQ